MKKFLKNQQGITMISIAVAIIILIIITNILVYNAKDSAYIRKLENMYNDIENLRGKISSYYSENGKIPANISSEYVIGTKEVKGAIGTADIGKFYVIDLKAIDSLSLNYGKDYEKITGILTVEEISKLTDIYIINEQTHNIFYVDGISVNGVKYYTDREPDNTVLNLKYHDQVRIPEGCTYISGNRATQLKIRNNNNGYEYIWIVVDNTITTKPEIVKVKDEYEFIASVNRNKGYFLYNGILEENVLYIPLDLGNWSDTYTKEGIYKDKNGDIAYVPAGYKVSLTPNMNTIYNGLVIKDQIDNEYVWINVPKKITEKAKNENEIEKALKEYTAEYRTDGYEDIWYDSKGLTQIDIGNDPMDKKGCGLTLQEYKTLKTEALNKISKNGGFYVGRYEAGTNIPKIEGDVTKTAVEIKAINGLPQSKKNMYTYSYVIINQAQGLANELNKTISGNKTRLMFGIEWDLICKFIETTGAKKKDEIKIDSSSFGNYYTTTFDVVKGSYRILGNNYVKITNKHIKPKDTYENLTTGITERNITANIYDLAGNLWEQTLEKKDKKEGVFRGGNAYNSEQDSAPLSGRRRLWCNNNWVWCWF